MFPQSPPLYLAMADFWAPTDGAGVDWAKVEAVADLAAQQTRATDGDGNYAWLYAQLGAHQQLEVDMVRDTALSWPRMRAAFARPATTLHGNYLVTYLFFGTLALSDALRSLQLFGTEVMPKLAAG